MYSAQSDTDRLLRSRLSTGTTPAPIQQQQQYQQQYLYNQQYIQQYPQRQPLAAAVSPSNPYYQPQQQQQTMYNNTMNNNNNTTDTDSAINLELGQSNNSAGAGAGGGANYSNSSTATLLNHNNNNSNNTSTNNNNKNSINTDDAQSLVRYQQFMYSLISLALLTIILAISAMGFQRSQYIIFVLLIVSISIYYTLGLTKWIFNSDDNNPAMRIIANAIKSGSEGFLTVQYGTIAFIALIVAALLAILYLFRDSPSQHISKPTLALITAIAYLIGAFCSGLAGYIGVWISVRVNIRVAVAASKLHYSNALLLSFRGGAVSAVLSASLCILGLTVLYVLCYISFHVFGTVPANQIPILLAGYGFGGALVALFMQLGGGIYTKAADVGADMCGKIEAGIPEDDPRNPAVIADLVGDNVGDCAGSMADVFESIAAEVIGTMILGASLAEESAIDTPESFIFFPLVIHALDLVVSGIGIFLTKSANDREDPIEAMKRSYALSMGIAAVAFIITCRLMLYTPIAPNAWMYFAGCGLIGIIMSFAIIRVTQYYTDYHYAPVKRIAAASATGHGTNVIAGISVGLESTAFPCIIIAVALFLSYSLGKSAGLPASAANTAGIYGTAVATMGMLCTAVYVLSMNNFGPIADNAGGIVEMSGQPESVRIITDRLDAVGNVTKAASKGYAVGGSALSCFVLFQAFLDEISAFIGYKWDVVNIARVEVICAGLLGLLMIFLFAGWAMAAVGATAQKVVWEVRRQLKSNPGIMDGTSLPDYNTTVAIVTKDALREMVKPALLALGLPVLVGFTFRFIGESTGRPLLGLECVASFMLFGTLSGLVMAVFMDNAGGAWDNAKKLIESQGLKGSEQHKAAVTGDTVGDPFKDTAGPALHVIITTMSTTILVLGPMFVGKSVEQIAKAL